MTAPSRSPAAPVRATPRRRRLVQFARRSHALAQFVAFSALLVVSTGMAAAAANAPMDTLRRADTLYGQGESAAACRTVYEALRPDGAALGGLNPDERAVLLRLTRSTVDFGLQAARRGDEITAVNAVSAGLSLSRRVLEAPDTGCADVKLGIGIWLLAEEGLENVWRILRRPERAAEVAVDRAAMERLARYVIMPRCGHYDGEAGPGSEPRERAEARALVRLWEYRLVRVAADNIG